MKKETSADAVFIYKKGKKGKRKIIEIRPATSTSSKYRKYKENPQRHVLMTVSNMLGERLKIIRYDNNPYLFVICQGHVHNSWFRLNQRLSLSLLSWLKMKKQEEL